MKFFIKVQLMANGIVVVSEWMLNKINLKINDSKTECVFVGCKASITRLTDLKNAIIGNDVITPQQNVWNLGASLDHDLSMRTQISRAIRSAYSYVTQNSSIPSGVRIHKIRHRTDHQIWVTAINAWVTSCIDYIIMHFWQAYFVDCFLPKLQKQCRTKQLKYQL